MNLWDLQPMEIGTILIIESKTTDSERLHGLGFSPGQDAQFLYKTALNGPRVYRLNDSLYSLSFSVASQILIEKKNP